MKDLNIHNDTRNRGLEILLYHPEEKEQVQEELKKFKVKISFLKKEFNFEFFITDKSKTPERD